MHVYTTDNKKEEEVLRTKLPKINLKHEDTKVLRALVKDMRRIMQGVNGVGLSANQVGIDKRLFIAEIPNKQGTPKFYTIINPKITKRSRKRKLFEEGCLSVPHTYGTIERSEKITIEALNINGKKIKITAWGFLAQVFQHETDHLDGMLYVDSATQTFDTELRDHEST